MMMRGNNKLVDKKILVVGIAKTSWLLFVWAFP